MTLVGDIITAAYRESNLIPVVATPTSWQQAEALGRLNTTVSSTVGFEVGKELKDITVGGQFDQSSLLTSWIPENVRLVLNLSSSLTLNLDPRPYEGQRFAIVDVLNNLSTASLTLNGNGRTLELDTSEVFDSDGFYGQWLYRADIANWTRISDLAIDDDLPFPSEFDDYFIVSLALRINPRFAQSLSQESAMALQRQREQIRARYRRPRRPQDTGTLGLFGQRGRSDPSETWLYR